VPLVRVAVEGVPASVVRGSPEQPIDVSKVSSRKDRSRKASKKSCALLLPMYRRLVVDFVEETVHEAGGHGAYPEHFSRKVPVDVFRINLFTKSSRLVFASFAFCWIALSGHHRALPFSSHSWASLNHSKWA